MSAETFRIKAARWVKTGIFDPDPFEPVYRPVPSMGLDPWKLLLWERDQIKPGPAKLRLIK